MKYVIGIDLGTSAVKALLINQNGELCGEASQSYPLIHKKSGYCEQNPEEWVEKTVWVLAELIRSSEVCSEDIEGISFSGQMHGLVLLDERHQVLRPAILWNDTRTTEQCQEMMAKAGDSLLQITRNVALEGFTLPKILWVRQHEREIYDQTRCFLLPKDYLRFRMSGKLHSEYSDAAGTLLLDAEKREWSKEICRIFDISEHICPPLVESHDQVGTLLPEIARITGLGENVRVFAGGADNACGAMGAGIVSGNLTMCSIGTSGVVLTHEEDPKKDFQGKVHFFNHAKENAYYAMGVTLAAGYSLSWFKDAFAREESFEDMLEGVESVPAGAQGLLFTPYISGERTPHADARIRGSFMGVDGSHQRKHFVRAVLEGITFSLNESIEIFRLEGKTIDTVVSIGGGAKNPGWLQMQADIFRAKVVSLANEQGPGLGAAILAAYGCGWFPTLEACVERFVHYAKVYEPNAQQAEAYRELYYIYRDVYGQTRDLCARLDGYRR